MSLSRGYTIFNSTSISVPLKSKKLLVISEMQDSSSTSSGSLLSAASPSGSFEAVFPGKASLTLLSLETFDRTNSLGEDSEKSSAG